VVGRPIRGNFRRMQGAKSSCGSVVRFHRDKRVKPSPLSDSTRRATTAPMRIPISLVTVSVASLSLVLSGCKSMPSFHFPKFSFGKKAAEGENDKDRSKRETAETAFLEICKKLGAEGDSVTGRDGYLFSGSEIKRLGATPEVGSGIFSAAVNAIADYRRQLKQNGTELVVAVVPPKGLIMADKVSKETKVPMKSGRPVALDSYYAAATEALSKKGVKVVYLNDTFLKARSGKAGDLYTKGSAQFTPAGSKLIATEIASTASLSKGEAGLVAKDGTIEGGNELGGKAEKLPVRQIFKSDGTTPLSLPDSGGTVLVIADQSVNLWKSDHASVAEQLSYELQRPVSVMSGSSARNEQRLKIMRQSTTGKNPLANTKLVVWLFNALDLSNGDWDAVPLKLEFKSADPNLRIN
jgi:hypothetical protein